MSYSLVETTTPRAADRRSSSEKFILCGLLLLGAIIWLPRLNGPLDLRWDAGAYYILSTSLAGGRGYRLLNEPGNIEAIQYPPLLPSVIAIYQLAFGTSDPHRVGQALRFTFAFVFIAFVLTSYLILKCYLPIAYALLGALIVLVNPTTIVISDFCLSDLPFALISTLFFLFHQNQYRLFFYDEPCRALDAGLDWLNSKAHPKRYSRRLNAALGVPPHRAKDRNATV